MAHLSHFSLLFQHILELWLDYSKFQNQFYQGKEKFSEYDARQSQPNSSLQQSLPLHFKILVRESRFLFHLDLILSHKHRDDYHTFRLGEPVFFFFFVSVSALNRDYSTHLLPKHALGPPLKGKNASLFQSDFMNLSGLKVEGSSQYLATLNQRERVSSDS